MKYIRKKVVVYRICDCVVDDPTQIKDLLISLQSTGIRFSLGVSAGYEYAPTVYQTVIVKDVREKDISIWVVNSEASLYIPSISISSITEINVTSTVGQDVKLNVDAGRWGLIDFDGPVDEVKIEDE